MKILTKQLSANDIGMTGSHQAGILIPKIGGYLSFFPRLDSSVRNPSEIIEFVDDCGKSWSFRFIYYNNRKFGGTRSEYRLTRMTAFMRSHGVSVGDGLVLGRDGAAFSVRVVQGALPMSKKAASERTSDSSAGMKPSGRVALVFDSEWNLIEEY